MTMAGSLPTFCPRNSEDTIGGFEHRPLLETYAHEPTPSVGEESSVSIDFDVETDTEDLQQRNRDGHGIGLDNGFFLVSPSDLPSNRLKILKPRAQRPHPQRLPVTSAKSIDRMGAEAMVISVVSPLDQDDHLRPFGMRTRTSAEDEGGPHLFVPVARSMEVDTTPEPRPTPLPLPKISLRPRNRRSDSELAEPFLFTP